MSLDLDHILKLMSASTPIILGVLAYLTAKANAKADTAAKLASVTARRVEATLAVTTSETSGKLGEIHELVNSRLTEALQKIDRLEQQRFETTGELPTGEPPARAT